MRRSTNENKLVTMLNPQSPISETYRTLRTNIQFSSLDRPVKTIMAASAEKNEGKTTTLSNLAVAYAQEGKKVLLIDADLRDPSLHHLFSQSNRAGLTSILANQNKWQAVISETAVDHLYLLTSGPIPPNPSELLVSERMTALLGELKEQFDLILFDTPPVLAVTDSLVVSAFCDGVILVVASGKADRELVKKAKMSLERVNARILGAVFNNVNRKDMAAAAVYDYEANR